MARTTPVSVKNKRRIAIGFTLIAVLMLLLAFRVAWIQVVQADELTEKAIEQQTSDIPIDAKRGEIYDRNGKELATSLTCYSLWVRPAQLAEELDEAGIDKLVQDLSEITGVKAETVKTRLTREQALVRVAKELEKEAADKVKELGIGALSLSEETKRYYPSGNFASQLLGSVTDDGTGRTGIELEYDQYLSGVAGRWVKNTDVSGNELRPPADRLRQGRDPALPDHEGPQGQPRVRLGHPRPARGAGSGKGAGRGHGGNRSREDNGTGDGSGNGRSPGQRRNSRI